MDRDLASEAGYENLEADLIVKGKPREKRVFIPIHMGAGILFTTLTIVAFLVIIWRRHQEGSTTLTFGRFGLKPCLHKGDGYADPQGAHS